MDLYAENILDHYRHPRHKSPPLRGVLPPEGGDEEGGGREGVIIHSESNPACGDEITVGFDITNGCIQNLSWDGTGCAISQAAMSMLSEELEEKSLKEIDTLTKENIFTLLGVPISLRRLKCALLSLHTLKNALRIHYEKPLQGWAETISEGH